MYATYPKDCAKLRLIIESAKFTFVGKCTLGPI